MLRRLLFWVCLVALSGCAANAATSERSLSAPYLPQISEIVSHAGSLDVSVRAALDPAGRPAFFWGGNEVAPTLRVRPGDVIHFHYRNDLPQICGLGLVSESNLHFHGLTSSPQSPGDNAIGIIVGPGREYDYTVAVGADQPPGLYWYHPHAHGLVNWEIGNGMAGAIVVDGIADEIPALAGLRERVIVLRDVPNDPAVAAAESSSVVTASAGNRATPQPETRDPDETANACDPEPVSKPTINGQLVASIGIQPGERQLWRVLNAAGTRHFDLMIPGTKLDIVAQDGVPLGYYHGAPKMRMVDHVVVPPSGRVEFVVTGGPHPRLFLSHCFDTGPSGETNPDALLAELDDDGGSSASGRVAPPAGLRPGAEYRVALPPPAQRRVIRFSEDRRGFEIDGALYDPKAAPLVTARAGTVEQWTLVNASDEVHAFHIHQVHFVVQSVNGVPNPTPHWSDVVDLPPQARSAYSRPRPSRVTVLIDFRNPVVRGTFLFHCHLTDHEDGGMMAKIRVI